MKLNLSTTVYAAYIGIDWADRKHDIALYDCQNEIWAQSTIQATPQAEEIGKQRWVHWRWSCPIFLRQIFVEWVTHARSRSVWSQAFYQQQRLAGKSHQKAIRALAYKGGQILWRCWQDRTPYDEEKYLAALRRKNSPLVALLPD